MITKLKLNYNYSILFFKYKIPRRKYHENINFIVNKIIHSTSDFLYSYLHNESKSYLLDFYVLQVDNIPYFVKTNKIFLYREWLLKNNEDIYCKKL